MAVFFMLAPPVWGGSDCVPIQNIMDTIAEHYGEYLIGAGITAEGSVLRLFATPDGSTWTMIQTFPNGCSMPAGSGTDWEVLTPNLSRIKAGST